MFWAGIMQDTRIPFHVFDNGSVNTQRYRQEVLEHYVRLSRCAVGSKFIFMDDNARAHRVLIVDEYLESEDIQRMAWTANSPDLNPIEHACDALGRAIAIPNLPQNHSGVKNFSGGRMGGSTTSTPYFFY